MYMMNWLKKRKQKVNVEKKINSNKPTVHSKFSSRLPEKEWNERSGEKMWNNNKIECCKLLMGHQGKKNTGEKFKWWQKIFSNSLFSSNNIFISLTWASEQSEEENEKNKIEKLTHRSTVENKKFYIPLRINLDGLKCDQRN